MPLLISLLFLLPACAAGKAADNSAFENSSAVERRWSAELRLNDDALPLTLVLLSLQEYAGEARLLIFSAFGASLGDCRLSPDRPVCRKMPGSGPVPDRVAGAVSRILDQKPSLLLAAEAGEVSGKGWQAHKRADGLLEYRQGTSWSLTLTGIKP